MRILRFLVAANLVLLAACQDKPETPLEAEPQLSVTPRQQRSDQLRVIVELRSHGDEAAVAQLATNAGGKVVRRYRRFALLALEVNQNALNGLRRSPHVVSIMEDVPTAPLLNTSLGVINADEVQALGWNGAGMSVAILDTGIDNAHPFVSGRVVEEACYSSSGTGEASLCPDGSNAQTGAGAASINVGNCQDGGVNICDHGMHVAGIAAGNGAGVTGAPAAGVAPGASIIAIQVFTRFNDDADCGGDPGDAPCVRTYPSDQIAGLERVLDLSASYTITAANMSLGGGMNTTACDGDSRKTAIDDLLAANIATVISSGNDGFDDAVGEPGCISTAVTVGATDNSDNVTRNRGPLLDLFAPGSGITSSIANNLFGAKGGTSMAAPHVTGAWAVLRQAEPTMSVADLLNLLRTTGVDITYLSAGSNVTTPRIDLAAALRATTDPPTLTADQATVNVNEGGAASNTGSFGDPNGDPVTLTASSGTVVAGVGGTWSWSFSTIDGPSQSRNVTITGTDNRGAQGTVTFALAVANVAPSVNAGADATITSNETFNFTGTFSDPGVIDFPWNWVIDWGDGTNSSGTTAAQSPVSRSHQFCAAQNYTVAFSVRDKDNGVGVDQLTLTVNFFAVSIDITPAQDPNSVSLSNKGLLPVALLSTATFDATQTDPATVTLGNGTGTETHVAQRPNGKYYAEVEDVNGDGLMDLVLRFSVPSLVANSDLTAGSTTLYLRGFLGNGCTNFQGSDSIRPVP